MESESPEKSQLRFSERLGLLVYEGEFSPGFPRGWVEPSHFAPPPGEVTLGSLPLAERESKNPSNKRLARQGVGPWTTTAVLPYFVSRQEAMDRRRTSFRQARRGRLNSDNTMDSSSHHRVVCAERRSKTVPVRAFR
jgi:hypothetical protein